MPQPPQISGCQSSLLYAQRISFRCTATRTFSVSEHDHRKSVLIQNRLAHRKTNPMWVSQAGRCFRILKRTWIIFDQRHNCRERFRAGQIESCSWRGCTNFEMFNRFGTIVRDQHWQRVTTSTWRSQWTQEDWNLMNDRWPFTAKQQQRVATEFKQDETKFLLFTATENC